MRDCRCVTRCRERIKKSYFGESRSGLRLREVKVKISSRNYRHIEAIAFRVSQKFV